MRKKSQKKKLSNILALVAILSSLLVYTAPLFNLKDRNGVTIPICTAYGIQTVTLDANGKKIPERKDPARQGCPFCIAASALKAPLLVAQVPPAPPVHKSFAPDFIYENPHLSSRASSSRRIRAPPAFS
ncbi:MAG: DUF2946 family protein [Alphaproteobacteria bacterium]|nr:DUF2946 family protein [Alphaproteobacteria bacterium]